MDGRRYLKDRNDVSADEVEHILALAHQIQEDEVHPAAPMEHATGPEVELSYLERAVSLHRNLRNDAARAAAVRKEEERALHKRSRGVGLAVAALLFAAVSTSYAMGSMGAAEIEAAESVLTQAELQLSRAVDDYAGASANLIVKADLDPAPFDRSLRLAREASSVAERVSACEELELALNAALLRIPPPRSAAVRAEQQALREAWVTVFSRLRYESENVQRARRHRDEEWTSPMGRLARSFGMTHEAP